MNDTPIDPEPYAKRAQRLSKTIHNQLMGEDLTVVGGALADLMSLWLAMHTPDVREEHFQNWIDCVKKLTPHSVTQIWATGSDKRM